MKSCEECDYVTVILSSQPCRSCRGYTKWTNNRVATAFLDQLGSLCKHYGLMIDGDSLFLEEVDTGTKIDIKRLKNGYSLDTFDSY